MRAPVNCTRFSALATQPRGLRAGRADTCRLPGRCAKVHPELPTVGGMGPASSRGSRERNGLSPPPRVAPLSPSAHLRAHSCPLPARAQPLPHVPSPELLAPLGRARSPQAATGLPGIGGPPGDPRARAAVQKVSVRRARGDCGARRERGGQASPARPATREGGGRQGRAARAAGKGLTVKQAASMDHVCALLQRLRAPLIPFRDGKACSAVMGERRERGDVKYAIQEQEDGGQRARRERSEPTRRREPSPRVPRPWLPGARARPLAHRRAARIPAATLASQPGADRRPGHRRPRHPPPLHRRGGRGASPGPGLGPVRTDGSGWGSQAPASCAARSRSAQPGARGAQRRPFCLQPSGSFR